MFEININEDDLREIEEHYDDITKFLLDNFISFSAAVFSMQSIIDAVNKAKIEMEEDNE